jgi:hypothetical protein
LAFLESNEEHEEQNEADLHTDHPNTCSIEFSPSPVAQTVSHFSNYYFDGKLLVCGLQGVFDNKKKNLQLSDRLFAKHTCVQLKVNFVSL